MESERVGLVTAGGVVPSVGEDRPRKINTPLRLK